MATKKKVTTPLPDKKIINNNSTNNQSLSANTKNENSNKRKKEKPKKINLKLSPAVIQNNHIQNIHTNSPGVSTSQESLDSPNTFSTPRSSPFTAFLFHLSDEDHSPLRARKTSLGDKIDVQIQKSPLIPSEPNPPLASPISPRSSNPTSNFSNNVNILSNNSNNSINPNNGNPSINLVNSQTKIFGIPISLAAHRSDHKFQMIPSPVRNSISYLNLRGLSEVGLYRVPGSQARVKEYKSLFDSGQNPDFLLLNEQTPTTISTLLIKYFIELPEPLLTRSLEKKFSEALSSLNITQNNNTTSNNNGSLSLESNMYILQALPQILGLLLSLPLENRETLRLWVNHLRLISEHEEVNKMGISNLARTVGISLGPTLGNLVRILIENPDLCPSTVVFGVPLDEAARCSDQRGLVPSPIGISIKYIYENSYHITEPFKTNLFCAARNHVNNYSFEEEEKFKSAVRFWKTSFNEGKTFLEDNIPSEVVMEIIKVYIEELPEHLLGDISFTKFQNLCLKFNINFNTNFGNNIILNFNEFLKSLKFWWDKEVKKINKVVWKEIIDLFKSVKKENSIFWNNNNNNNNNFENIMCRVFGKNYELLLKVFLDPHSQNFETLKNDEVINKNEIIIENNNNNNNDKDLEKNLKMMEEKLADSGGGAEWRRRRRGRVVLRKEEEEKLNKENNNEINNNQINNNNNDNNRISMSKDKEELLLKRKMSGRRVGRGSVAFWGQMKEGVLTLLKEEEDKKDEEEDEDDEGWIEPRSTRDEEIDIESDSEEEEELKSEWKEGPAVRDRRGSIAFYSQMGKGAMQALEVMNSTHKN